MKVSLRSTGELLPHPQELPRQVPSFKKRYPDTCGQGLRPDANPCWRHCCDIFAHYHTGHPVKDVAVYSWFNKGCFGNRELRIGKLLFGDHSSKSLHCSICSNDRYQSNLFWFSCIQISNFQLFGINNNGTSSNHNLRNWWVAKTLMSSCIICKVWGFQREFLRNYPVYWAQIFGDNWNCYAFSIIRVFTSLASAIR